MATTHIQSLADSDAADQLFFQNQYGVTVLIYASMKSLELVQLMITKAKLDSRKRCLLVVTNQWGETALHYAAYCHGNPAVLELLIREHPLALCATNSDGHTPLQHCHATILNHLALVISILADAIAALAALVHGDWRALQCLALSPARLATLVSILICLHRLTAEPNPPSTQWSAARTRFSRRTSGWRSSPSCS